MSNKKEVKVKIKKTGKTSVIKVAGRHVMENAPKDVSLPGEVQNLNVEIDDVGGSVNVAGDSVISFAQQIAQPLDELSALVSNNLKQEAEIEDLRELIDELKGQATKPETDRSMAKINRLLSSVGSYITMATFAVTQAEHAQKLFEMVRKLFNPG